jgi:hypothetical protein
MSPKFDDKNLNEKFLAEIDFCKIDLRGTKV